MNRPTLYFILLFALAPIRTQAIQKSISGVGTYNTTAPTAADIPNWATGWGQTGITGWDYVGTVNGASGVYLGNNWVITASHVGAGTFTLSGTAYTVLAGSIQGVTNPGGATSPDLTLFQLTLAPNLPALPLATTAPSVPGQGKPGSSVAMIGFGGGQGKTWGLNTVTRINQTIVLNGTSTDFVTDFGSGGSGPTSYNNQYTFVTGDSGGGGFIYDSTNARWTLAGINSAVDSSKGSYMVQLSSYATQINSIITVPEPSTYALVGLGLAAFLFRSLRKTCSGGL